MWTETLSRALTVVLVTCALVVTGGVVYQNFFRGAEPGGKRYVENWESLASTGHRWGPKDAPVEVVVFFDYQCPYCKQAMATLDTMRRRYPNRVAVVFRHLPLPIHPQAASAARAAECAVNQDRFRAYHNLLFANQDRLENVVWDSLAVSADVSELKAFRECIAEQKSDRRIERDVQAATRLALRSVPVLIVNGRLLRGAPPSEVLDQLIQTALTRVRSQSSVNGGYFDSESIRQLLTRE